MLILRGVDASLNVHFKTSRKVAFRPTRVPRSHMMRPESASTHKKSQCGYGATVRVWIRRSLSCIASKSARWHRGACQAPSMLVPGLLSRRVLRLLSRPGLRRSTACLSRQGCTAATISAYVGRSCYLGMHGLQLLSRHMRAAATISTCAGRSYYLGAGSSAAISAWAAPRLLSRRGLRCSYYLGLRGPRLLSRHERSVSERVGYYLRLHLP